MGNPLARVPHGQTVHRTVWPPLLSFWESGRFRPLRWARKGSAPPPRKLVLFKESLVRDVPAAGVKRWTKLLCFDAGGWVPFLGQPQSASCPPQARDVPHRRWQVFLQVEGFSSRKPGKVCT